MLWVDSSDAGGVLGRFSVIIWSFGLRWSRMLVVESSDGGDVMRRICHNHMVLWSKVQSNVGG